MGTLHTHMCARARWIHKRESSRTTNKWSCASFLCWIDGIYEEKAAQLVKGVNDQWLMIAVIHLNANNYIGNNRMKLTRQTARKSFWPYQPNKSLSVCVHEESSSRILCWIIAFVLISNKWNAWTQYYSRICNLNEKNERKKSFHVTDVARAN